LTDIIVRPAVESDADAFLSLWEALDTETEFMLFEPGERAVTLDEQKSRLAKAKDSPYLHILVLEDCEHNLLAGFCAGRRSSNFRDRHSLAIVVGIRQQYTGKQWGQKLLGELEQWAASVGVSRLELSVMVNNVPAITLYQKSGFSIEGTKKNAVYLKSGYVDEHLMAKHI